MFTLVGSAQIVELDFHLFIMDVGFLLGKKIMPIAKLRNFDSIWFLYRKIL
jgi:hypothetical protein